MPSEIIIEARAPQAVLPRAYKLGELVYPAAPPDPKSCLKSFRYVGYGCLIGIGYRTGDIRVWSYERAIGIGTPRDGRVPTDEEVSRANLMLLKLFGEDVLEYTDSYDLE